MGAGEDFNFQEAATKTVTAAVSGALDPASDVRVRTQGIAAQVLLDACVGADLLVVGSRGHGGFTKALLGLGQPALRAAHTLLCRGDPRPGPRVAVIGVTAAASRPVLMASLRAPDSRLRKARALRRWPGS